MTFARALCGTDLNQDYSDSLFLIDFVYPAAATLQITMAFLQGLGIRYLNSSKDNAHLGKTFEDTLTFVGSSLRATFTYLENKNPD